MYGMIFTELKRFSESDKTNPSWKELLQDAQINRNLYLNMKDYPDEELVKILTSWTKLKGIPLGQLLEDFGRYITPSLMTTYGDIIKSDWRTLDVLENVEDTIHKVVRFRNPGAQPPQLEARRIGDKEVEIIYRSPRKVCHLARGIAYGLADYYSETLSVQEKTCMHKGDDRCTLIFKLVS